jgi:subtilisin family serine protease
VLAAGNEATDCSNKSPASTNGNGIFTVSAHDVNKYFASFSNFGSPVDFAAPGVNVLSSRPGGGTVSMSGTSMAAPHVAGLLMAYGNVGSNGFVIGDKDAIADPIAFRP